MTADSGMLHNIDAAWDCLRKAGKTNAAVAGRQIGKTWYPTLDAYAGLNGIKEAANICIVTKDFIGPNRNGGIGTACTLLAKGLVARGHKVTVVYTLKEIEHGPLPDWVEHYKTLDIDFIPLPDPVIPRSRETRQPAADARAVYEYLLPRHFDIIHFTDWQGLGFYCLLAKQLGLAFQRTALCVTTHSPTQWNFDGNYALIDDEDVLITSYFERKSVEWADIVLSPSRYMLRWYESQAWPVPRGKSFVQPHMLAPISFREKRHMPVSELVFFGRLERRKGLEVFIKALRLLRGDAAQKIQVTLLGKFGRHMPPEVVNAALQGLTQSVTIINGYHTEETLAYLKEEGRLAVIPSLCDNSPLTVSECMTEGIPFVCSDVGGISELIHKDDAVRVMCPPIPHKLADLLSRVIEEGGVCPRPACDYTKNAEAIDLFHKKLAYATEQTAIQELPDVSGQDVPLVSICITHKDRPEYLKQTLQGIENQTYCNIEVILLDDGSQTQEAHAYLDSLIPLFASRNWTIVRQENRYAGAARNMAVQHAKGEFILLMDDDNVAKPHQVARFVQVALYNNADIVSCGKDYVDCSHYPGDKDVIECHYYHGGPAGHGFFTNCLGDTNSLIRRSVFAAMGGFTEHYGIGRCDHEFFTRATLQGWKLVTLPESLLWYRVGHLRLGDIHQPAVNAGLIRVLSAYANVLPPDILDGLRLALGSYEKIRKPVGR
jgi:glycosyltransferase involved in cell wall biosynthesis